MKKVLKRSLSIFLAITIIFSSAIVGLAEVDFNGLFAVKVHAASASDLTFTLNADGESYSVTNCDTSAIGDIIIPDIFDGLPVTNIADWAFGNCENITSISIPDCVKTIGVNVFSYCTSLVSINVDYTNTNYSSIDGILFSKDNCILLQYPSGKTGTTYTIPDFVTNIGDEAFGECTNLVSIEIPGTVTNIGCGAFAGCSNLKSVQIPNSVTKIESGTFYACSNLENFVIPDSVTSIGNQTFELCTNLSSLTIGNNVTSIGWNAFMRCQKLASVIIPDSVESIGDSAFNMCTSLTSITIPRGVTSIGDSTFFNCKNLTSITIPDGITSIGNCAFYNCTSLKYVFYYGSETDWVDISIGSNNEPLINAIFHYSTIDHKYRVIVDTEVTCTQSGLNHLECTVCGYTSEKKEVPAFGHDYSDWIIDVEATCTGNGSKYKTCVLCNDVVYENIEAFGHNYSTEWTIDVVPTQLNKGEKSHHCLNCDARKDITAIPVVSIDDIMYIETDGLLCNGEITYIIKLKADVAVSGSILGVVYNPDVLEPVDEKCGACTTIDNAGNEKTNYNGLYETGMKYNTNNTFVVAHMNTKNIVRAQDTEYVKFTFKVKDFSETETKVDFYCVEFTGDSKIAKNDYSVVLSNFVEDIYTYDHTISNEWTTDVAPTCTEDGSKSHHCLECGSKFDITDIIATGHDYSIKWIIDKVATCTEEGSKSHHCSKCDSKSDVTVIEANGHNYGDWVVIQEPTCTGEGVLNKICSVCGDVVKEAISAYGHSYSDEWTIDLEPTCIEEGSKSHHCTVCDDKTDITVIEANGHNYGDWVIDTEVTCTKEGSKNKTCSDCGDVVTESIPALGHDYSTEWTIDVEATCSDVGSKSHHCTVCGDKTDITEIEANGHNYVKEAVDEKHPHTITYECTFCEDIITETPLISWCVECNFTITAIDSSSYKLVSYSGSETDVIIPAIYNERAITTIANGCFRNNNNITSIKIAEGVTSIGSLAFMNCTSLKKVLIPASVISIGTNVFYGFKGTIYCTSGSVAHEYAIANNINYVLVSIQETENTQIDYDNFIIRTSVQKCNEITAILGVSESAIAIPIASYVQGNHELYGTGTIISVFDGDEYIGDFTLIVEGDTNGDSVCDVLDCYDVERASNGNAELTGACAMAADSNADDEVDITDYQAIVNKALAS